MGYVMINFFWFLHELVFFVKIFDLNEHSSPSRRGVFSSSSSDAAEKSNGNAMSEKESALRERLIPPINYNRAIKREHILH
jgi:hypothetical protein